MIKKLLIITFNFDFRFYNNISYALTFEEDCTVFIFISFIHDLFVHYFLLASGKGYVHTFEF